MAGRRPGEREVRAHLRQQSRVQWGGLVFTWVFCAAAFWLLGRFTPLFVDPFAALMLPTLLVGVQAWGERRRARRVRHAQDADPVLVQITRLEPRVVTVSGPRGQVRQPTSSTGGLSVGDDIWAAPAPAPGESVVLVPHEVRLGGLAVLTPRGAATATTASPDVGVELA